ncbi:MAG: DUF1553 domain-containing protein [Acidobacteria bacterium]|nr:DUF1553 domain-containing protein [Acidobacteriota bacterium]
MNIARGLAAAFALWCVNAPAQTLPQRWSFPAHITPILTFGGCNQSACHGSPVGKKGFKLSLYGSDPEKDYQTLLSTRVNVKEPEDSLLLKKPTMQVAHGGGPRFKKESQHYATLKAWIEAGAPYGDKNAPALTRIEVTPGYRVLTAKEQSVQLRVEAVFSDARREDVTALSLFSSNDEAVLKVTAAGKVSPDGGTGDAAILVRYAGKFAAPVFGATLLPSSSRLALPEHPIDREVYAKLNQLHIAPAEQATDSEFLRRAYLDITGTLPTAADTRQFLASTAPSKRALLVDQLLEKPEYADLQTLIWADRLRSDVRFHRVGGVRSYFSWMKSEFLLNRPLDQFARSLLTAKGPNFANGAANYWGNYDKISTPIETAIQTGQVFLGIRVGCAQCHNHPFEKWTQSDFYSLAAVFSQVVEFHTKNSQEFDLRIDPNRAVIHPATKQAAEPRFFGGGIIDVAPGEDRRPAFAKWLTAPDNPYFAKAMANQIWRTMMGRGIVQPVDDFRDTNPPTHPALLDLLAKELITHRFDQKHLIRFIAASKTYQHSSRENPTNKLDFKYYSRSYPKRLMAEVYMDAISQVTNLESKFNNWPEARRAVQLPDNRYNSYFLDVFERSNRLVICDREENVTVSQALHFVNSPDVQAKIASPESRLAQWLESGKSDSEVLEELFLTTMSRTPSAKEKDRLLTRIGQTTNRKELFEDVLWAILNSREFIFNH